MFISKYICENDISSYEVLYDSVVAIERYKKSAQVRMEKRDFQRFNKNVMAQGRKNRNVNASTSANTTQSFLGSSKSWSKSKKPDSVKMRGEGHRMIWVQWIRWDKQAPLLVGSLML